MESRVGRRERCRAAPWGNDKPRSLRAGFVGEKEVVECGCVWPHASKQASIRDPRFGTLDLGPSICDPRFDLCGSTTSRIRQHLASDHLLPSERTSGHSPFAAGEYSGPSHSCHCPCHCPCHHIASSNVNPSHSLFGSPFRSPFKARHLSLHRLRPRAPLCDLRHARG